MKSRIFGSAGVKGDMESLDAMESGRITSEKDVVSSKDIVEESLESREMASYNLLSNFYQSLSKVKEEMRRTADQKREMIEAEKAAATGAEDVLSP